MAQPAIDTPIKSVHVFSTGSGAQHKEHRYGSLMPSMWWVLTSRSWVKIPINVFLIEHKDGLVLFDAGLDPAVDTDPNYISNPIVRFFRHKLFRLHIEQDDTLTAKLNELGYGACDIRKVVVSHLHFDHVGCIKEVPDAELLVSRDEWRLLSNPHSERDFIFREHIDLPKAKWRQIDFSKTDDALLSDFDDCYDVMGDGSLVVLPTPGHTAGSISMLVRTEARAPLLLVGDLTYEADLLMNDQFPGTGDKAQLCASFAKVRALKEKLPDLVILPAHDFAAQPSLSAW